MTDREFNDLLATKVVNPLLEGPRPSEAESIALTQMQSDLKSL